MARIGIGIFPKTGNTGLKDRSLDRGLMIHVSLQVVLEDPVREIRLFFPSWVLLKILFLPGYGL